ncbi:acyltransferase [Sphingomonas suaedae]|uniref:Acyltransferase n=1 Tax=Sphingomonas suaedae TaxID=2599297 RepID=A0A518RJ66_9SPHN|nr:acyltransferase [Sphingomonas suaedae]QDX27470.1 acyltransferase [Sphingomonas suaedae]
MVPSQTSKPTVINVQYLRALAAIIVAFSHSAADVARLHGVQVDFPLPGPFGVEIFFVISGFIICHANLDRAGQGGKRVLRFLNGRFWRIVPFYWLCTTLYLAIAMLAAGTVNRDSTSIAHVVASYAFLPWPAPDGRIGPVYALGWSLNFEMFFYAFFAGAMFLRPRWALAALTLVFVSLAALHPYFPEPGALAFWSAPYILEFVIGMWLSVLSRRIDWRGPGWAFWPVALAILAIAAAFFQARHVPGSGEGVTPWSILFASLLVAAGVFLRPANDVAGIFGRVGDSSYSLYLLHMFVIRAGVIALGITGVYWPYPLTMLALVAASCIVSWYSFRYIETWFAEQARRRPKDGDPMAGATTSIA